MRRPPGPLLGRPSDLKPASVLGARRPHGHKMRYMAGCRCPRCRVGNAQYEARLARERKLYGPNDLVSSERVLAHLRYLKTFGIGHKTVAKHARVAKTGLAEIIWYGKQHLRRRAEARILAIQPSLETLPRNVNIPADETVAKINQLTLWGYPKRFINQQGLHHKANAALQIRAVDGDASTVMVKTAVAVRDFFAHIVELRRVWESKRGPIPPRRFVWWKPRRGRRPAKPTVRRLELRPFAVTYDCCYVWPKELREASALRSRLKNLYRTLQREGKHGEKQNGGSAQSPVRSAGAA